MNSWTGEPLNKVYYDEKILGKKRAVGDDVAQREGLNQTVASGSDMTSHVRELLKKFAGPDWCRGATLNVRFIRPAVARETVMQNCKVLKKAPGNGTVRIMVVIAAEQETGDRVAVGRASVHSGVRAAYIETARGAEHVDTRAAPHDNPARQTLRRA